MSAMKPLFFATPGKLRAWFDAHHDRSTELWVGFYKTGSGKPSVTWPDVVDCALCFGWIDGLRKSIDETRWMIRVTPRKPRSIWSANNITRIEKLRKAGLMHPRGLAAFEGRDAKRSNLYSYERGNAKTLSDEYAAMLRKNGKARAFFEAQAQWYQRQSSFWVMSAKKEETRLRRLETLIADSAAGRLIAPARAVGRKPRATPSGG